MSRVAQSSPPSWESSDFTSGAVDMVKGSPRRQLAAFRDFRSHMRFWLLVIGGLAADLLSKQWVLRNLVDSDSGLPDRTIDLIPDYLRFVAAFN